MSKYISSCFVVTCINILLASVYGQQPSHEDFRVLSGFDAYGSGHTIDFPDFEEYSQWKPFQDPRGPCLKAKTDKAIKSRRRKAERSLFRGKRVMKGEDPRPIHSHDLRTRRQRRPQPRLDLQPDRRQHRRGLDRLHQPNRTKKRGTFYF